MALDLEEKSAKIGMLTENGLILRNCEKEGSYLIFDMEDIGEFLILEKKTNPLPFLFIKGFKFFNFTVK